MVLNPDARHILFITSSRIGDAVLSSGLPDYMVAQCPDAKFTVCCGPLAVPLFEGFPALERIIPIEKQRYNRHWLDLWRKIRKTRFDAVVDLRNSIVSRLIRARQRFIAGRSVDKTQHKVVQNASVLGLSDHPPAPRLWFTAAQEKQAALFIPDGPPVLGVGPTANWAEKMWPAERFAGIVDWMTSDDGLMPGARVAVFAAPGEEEPARRVLDCVPEDRRLDIIARTDPGTAAACLARCAFYIGNDSGLMHCATAAGTPTLGLFGPGYPDIYRPWGTYATYVSTPEKLMELLTVEAVKKAIERHFLF